MGSRLSRQRHTCSQRGGRNIFTVDDSQELGVLEDTIILHTETGINPFFMGGDEFLHLKARTLCRPEKWILNPDLLNTAAYTFSMNFIVQLDIEGTMSADESDIVWVPMLAMN